MKNIFLIKDVPSDTRMREVLDDASPNDISPLFKEVFKEVQRGKLLEDMEFMDGHYLMSNDGTGCFSSSKVHCENCLVKTSSKTGKKTYHHQMLSSAIVHPDQKVVIPLCPEPIIKQDGETKNDCERNAAKRLLANFRKDHPYLKVIVVEDALVANAPHIKDLEKHNCKYIIGAKQDGNKFLFEQVESEKGKVTEFDYEEIISRVGKRKQQLPDIKIIHKFKFINKVPLNESNQDVLVNFIEYWETKPNGKIQHFSWITDIEVTEDNVFKIMKGARARWKIENETFNTLKNQGYKFEHNFGHGKNSLSTVLALLMMLAFLIDQIQQKACSLFKAVLIKLVRKKYLWEKMRGLFYEFEFNSMQNLFEAMLYGFKNKRLEIAYQENSA